MEGKWFDLCSLEKSEKSVVDQISQCSSVVAKNPKNSYDIFINAYSYCNSHVDHTHRVTWSSAATGWQKKINNSARIICLCASDSSERRIIAKHGNCETLSSFSTFTFVHFQGGGGSEKVYGLYACKNDDNYG